MAEEDSACDDDTCEDDTCLDMLFALSWDEDGKIGWKEPGSGDGLCRWGMAGVWCTGGVLGGSGLLDGESRALANEAGLCMVENDLLKQ